MVWLRPQTSGHAPQPFALNPVLPSARLAGNCARATALIPGIHCCSLWPAVACCALLLFFFLFFWGGRRVTSPGPASLCQPGARKDLVPVAAGRRDHCRQCRPSDRPAARPRRPGTLTAGRAAQGGNRVRASRGLSVRRGQSGPAVVSKRRGHARRWQADGAQERARHHNQQRVDTAQLHENELHGQPPGEHL